MSTTRVVSDILGNFQRAYPQLRTTHIQKAIDHFTSKNKLSNDLSIEIESIDSILSHLNTILSPTTKQLQDLLKKAKSSKEVKLSSTESSKGKDFLDQKYHREQPLLPVPDKSVGNIYKVNYKQLDEVGLRNYKKQIKQIIDHLKNEILSKINLLKENGIDVSKFERELNPIISPIHKKRKRPQISQEIPADQSLQWSISYLLNVLNILKKIKYNLKKSLFVILPLDEKLVGSLFETLFPLTLVKKHKISDDKENYSKKISQFETFSIEYKSFLNEQLQRDFLFEPVTKEQKNLNILLKSIAALLQKEMEKPDNNLFFLMNYRVSQNAHFHNLVKIFVGLIDEIILQWQCQIKKNSKASSHKIKFFKREVKPAYSEGFLENIKSFSPT